MSMSEAELQALILDAAQWSGWRCYHTHDSRRSGPHNGFPDLCLVRNGECLFWELKTAKGRVSAQQKMWIQRLDEVPGIEARVIRPDDIDYAIDRLRRR